MNEVLRSVLLGTAGLSVTLLLAAVLTATRRFGSVPEVSRRLRMQRLFQLAILIQGIHVFEELVTGFHVLFPESLGLAPWPTSFYVVFNLGWIAIWCVAAAALPTGKRWVFLPLWFFVIAMVMNSVAHPILALRVGGYFPGLWTSPLVGVAGLLLWLQLVRGTRPRRKP